MNKKVIIVLSVILIMIIIGGVVFIINKNYKDNKDIKDNNIQIDEIINVMENENITGGWNYTKVDGEVNLPKEIKTVFDKAMSEIDGADYKVVAYLGEQLVAGKNYSFLCETTPVVQNPRTELKNVVVYEDLSGNIEINDIKDLSIVGTDTEVSFEELTGGWNCDESVGFVSDEVKNIVNKALNGMVGVQYTPLACLGEQVVAGMNYKVLCKATSVTNNPVSKLAVLTIYKSLNGEASVTSISNFIVNEY